MHLHLKHILSSSSRPSPPLNLSQSSMTPPNDHKPQTPRADFRWSEVVQAPATALTFAALWDPEEGIVTFSGAELGSPRYQALSRSQTLTIDGGDGGDLPSTAQGSGFFPYAHSRFAASELSTARFPASPTRRSSAGTGLPLDKSNHVDLHYHADGAYSIAISCNVLNFSQRCSSEITSMQLEPNHQSVIGTNIITPETPVPRIHSLRSALAYAKVFAVTHPQDQVFRKKIATITWSGPRPKAESISVLRPTSRTMREDGSISLLRSLPD